VQTVLETGEEEKGEKKWWDPQFGGEDGGPPGMEGGSGNLEEYGK
jgi:hypothetical protein